MKIVTTLVAAALLAGAASAPAQNAGFQIGIAQPTFGFPPTQAPAVAVRGGTFAGNGGFLAPAFGPVMVQRPPFIFPGHPPFPGQQFIVPGQQYFAPGQQFIVPGQQFIVPGQQYVVPGQQFIVPGQQYVVPGRQFIAPGQQFVVPNQQFITPNHVVAASPVFIPNQQFPAPGQVFIPQPVVAPPTIVVVPAVQAPAAHPGPSVHARPLEPADGTPRAHVIQLLGQPIVSVITSRGEILQFTGGATVVIQNGVVVRSR